MRLTKYWETFKQKCGLTRNRYGLASTSLNRSRLPSSLSQLEEAVRHRRGRRGRDGEPLVDGFQDKAAVEAPGEGAEVARQMFGVDHTMCGQEAVLDVRRHRVRPAEGGVARSGAIGAGDMSLMVDAGLFGDASKPLAAIADDSGSGLNTRAWSLRFAGLEPAHDLKTGGQRPRSRGGRD